MFKEGDQAVVTGNSRYIRHFYDPYTKVTILNSGYVTEDDRVIYLCTDGSLQQSVVEEDLTVAELVGDKEGKKNEINDKENFIQNT